MSKVLEGLNKEQKEAALFDKKPLLIIAGAGTGKTTVLTRKIAYLISSKKAKPSEILALTFTDKAAAEMEERVDILIPYGYADVLISTFHSFGDEILRENALYLGLTADFKVLTKAEQVIFFKEHLFEFPLSHYRPLGNPTRYIEAVINLFSRAKDEDISAEEYLDYAERLESKADNPEQKEIAQREKEVALCYQKYEELLLKNNCVDFGNQVYLTHKLFSRHPAVLKKYQQKFRYILVDEFQDTNYSQFQLVNFLSGEQKNITAVADDDQAIYRFRGAAIGNILNFKKAYPEFKEIVLTKNYRSNQRILDTAYRLIQYNNPQRLEAREGIDKRLISHQSPVTSHQSKAKKQKELFEKEEENILSHKEVEHLHFETVSDEADRVAEIIKKAVESKKYSYQDFAILVRSNNDAAPFIQALNIKGIPYNFSGSQRLYAREEIKNIISFLKIITNLYDSLSLYYLASSEIYQLDTTDLTRCMNYASRRRRGLYEIFNSLSKIPDLQSISTESKATIEKIIQDIQHYIKISRQQTTGRLMYLFLSESGYINRLSKSSQPADEQKIENIAKFFDIVRNSELLLQENRVVNFVQHLDALIEVGDDPATAEVDPDIPLVNILTVHKAKGLEFRVVFSVSSVMQKFPLKERSQQFEISGELIKDIMPERSFHLQEERRLFYVAMTRAKENLFLSSARDYGGKRARKISQFVLEALDLPVVKEASKTSALERIKRNVPSPPPLILKRSFSAERILNLSYFQIDDYLTCPLKYKYVHILRVPIMPHYAVVYGRAMHIAVGYYYQRKMQKTKFTREELLAHFDVVFVNEGFLTREHEELAREQGKKGLSLFFDKEEQSKKLPTYI
ncbi:MAG: ATP-dependent helicase, partial [Candidatus Omnitrophica bacterium]|nr:ATP-dependent helicase [Candidatus Omnitrophota bacterium]